MKTNRCIFCMHEIPEGEKKCPHCHKGIWQYQWNPTWLKPYTMLAGRYMVGRVLGEGGFGATYLAFDEVTEKCVAIKEAAQKQEKLLATAERLPSLPFGLVNVYEVFSEEDRAYMVMEYLPGLTLKEWMQREGQIPQEEALALLKPVMEALACLHSEGGIHCDVSPDNLLFDASNQLKLIDFGAMQFADIKETDTELKEGYGPLEQYQEKDKIGPWTDIYAVCAVLYELLTGRKVPSAPDRVAEDDLHPIHEYARIDVASEQAVMRGLSLDIQKRFFGMDGLMKALTSEHKSQEDQQKDLQLAQKTRECWGGLWIEITTKVERDSKFISKKQKNIKNLIKIAIVFVCIVSVCFGGYYGGRQYMREHKELIFDYKLKSAMKKAEKKNREMARAEAQGEVMSSKSYLSSSDPEFAETVAFIRKHGLRDEENKETERYSYTIKDAREWKLSTEDPTFYLDMDTIQEIVEYKMNLSANRRSEFFYGSAEISTDESGVPSQLHIFQSLSESIYFDKTEGKTEGRYMSIEGYPLNKKAREVSLGGSKKDVRLFMKDVMPYLAPEVILYDNQIDEIINSAEEAESKRYSVMLNAKYRLAFSAPEEKSEGYYINVARE
ncbi:serine/threonine protein kinase [Hespellia stercorisuis]|uniref:non-specific serine/threonine protein kinase n=1 Tax=Hespellia stercorisuis DSM 15480 TaxID=1121950 RepID=A0A1M6R6G1_9FIRM|nr:serine/threonine-protein kinase [Hespellia stercorisuis]SHK27990.1 Protein kinase domain-containing protein [Hespellia stercorisuis DSM 15480]